MNFEWTTINPEAIPCDTLVIIPPTAIDQNFLFLPEADRRLNDQLFSFLKEDSTKKDFGTATFLYTFGMVKAKQILFLGRGETALKSNEWRQLFGIAAKALKKEQAKKVTVLLLDDVLTTDATVISHAVEGLILGSYSFDQYKAKKESTTVKTCSFVGGEEPADFSQIVEHGLILSENVKLVRQLVNEPAAVMTPSAMEAKAKAIAKKCGLVFDCLGRKQLEEQKMNAFLAVAQGSEEKPKLLVLEYKGNPDHSECIALIGKGITFDSGGLSLKPSSGMEEMKDDMGGAATVLGTIKALAELKVKINVMAIMPCTENMPSGSAYRPGDIITAMSGKTIEVVNTDAEGRLILADAITYAKEKGATKLIDVATLTGACVVALGAVAAGVFTNKQEWGQKLLDASEETGEKMWQLPLFKEYDDLIKSQVADIKNSGGREAGASTAACFLQHFAGATPWIHIDIAGVVTTQKNQGYQVKGATGAGVFTLVKLFESLSHE